MSASIANMRLIELQNRDRGLAELRRDLGQARASLKQYEGWLADALHNTSHENATFREIAQRQLAEKKQEYGGPMRDLRNQIATLERKEYEIIAELERQADHEEKADRERRDRAAKLEADLQLPTLRLLARAATLRVAIADTMYHDALSDWSVPYWARPSLERLEIELASIAAEIAALAVAKK